MNHQKRDIQDKILNGKAVKWIALIASIITILGFFTAYGIRESRKTRIEVKGDNNTIIGGDVQSGLTAPANTSLEAGKSDDEKDGQASIDEIVLSSEQVKLRRMATQKLMAVVYYSDGSTDNNVTWISEDPSVATIDEDGELRAVDVGNTRVCAISGNQRAYCSVKVGKSPSGYQISLSSKDVELGEKFYVYVLPKGQEELNQIRIYAKAPGGDTNVYTLKEDGYYIDTEVGDWEIYAEVSNDFGDYKGHYGNEVVNLHVRAVGEAPIRTLKYVGGRFSYDDWQDLKSQVEYYSVDICSNGEYYQVPFYSEDTEQTDSMIAYSFHADNLGFLYIPFVFEPVKNVNDVWVFIVADENGSIVQQISLSSQEDRKEKCLLNVPVRPGTYYFLCYLIDPSYGKQEFGFGVHFAASEYRWD